MRKQLLMGLLLLAAVSLTAQNRQSSVFKPADNLKMKGFLEHLIDPSRFEMTHSYTMMVSNVAGQTLNQGLYLNTMNYQFSDPLRMQVRVGYMHQPFGGPNVMQNQQNKIFLQRAMLEYKPSKNTKLVIDYQQVPYNIYSDPYGYGRGFGFGRSRWWHALEDDNQ